MISRVLLLILVFSHAWRAAAQSLTVGVETDFPNYYFGSYAPGGIIGATFASYQRLFATRLTVGGIEASQPHFAFSLESCRLFLVPIGAVSWSIDPLVGAALARSKSYLRMTGQSRVGPNGEHFDTYDYADSATSYQVFFGARSAWDITEGQRLSFSLGFIHEYRFATDNFQRKEIRNCYEDECPDSNKSGGGQWPDPKDAWYLTVGYEFDLVGKRPSP